MESYSSGQEFSSIALTWNTVSLGFHRFVHNLPLNKKKSWMQKVSDMTQYMHRYIWKKNTQGTYRSTRIMCQPPLNTPRRIRLQWDTCQTWRSPPALPQSSICPRISRWWSRHKWLLPFPPWPIFWLRKIEIRWPYPMQSHAENFASINWMHHVHSYRMVCHEWRTWCTHFYSKIVKIAPNTKRSISCNTKCIA